APTRSRPPPLRQRELVHFLWRQVLRRPRIPRRDWLSPRRIERLHWRPPPVDPIGEQIADQEIGDRALQIRVLAHELAEAEAVVVLADQSAHPIDPGIERRPPLAQLRGGGIAVPQPLDDRVG